MRVTVSDSTLFTAMLGDQFGFQFDAPVTGLSIDSRFIEPGDLFVPLHGAQADGHDFIPQALQAGAGYFLTQAASNDRRAVPVTETELALLEIARNWRRQFTLTVAAITGSNGKTTTKSIVAQILGSDPGAVVSDRSYNSTTGLPLSLLRISAATRLLVIEIGANQPGEIALLADIARPDFGLVTNVLETHTAAFGDLDGIAREKGALFAALPADGTAVINMDDSRVRQMPAPARTFQYGFSSDPQNAALDLSARYTADERPALHMHNGTTIRLPQASSTLAACSLAAAALCTALAIAPELISAGIETYRLPPGRGGAVTVEGILFIDDSWNANLASTAAGLRVLAAYPADQRKVFVFGDMLELGQYAVDHHKLVGSYIENYRIDRVYCYGPLSEMTADVAEKAGLAVQHFDDQQELIATLKSELQPGDIVYLKGSRGMRMENVLNQGFGVG